MTDRAEQPPPAPPPSNEPGRGPGAPPGFDVDVREKGADIDGQPQVMDRRLFMQLLVFRVAQESNPGEVAKRVGAAFTEAQIPFVLYEDVNDPRGLGVLTFSENPDHFVTAVRPVLGRFGELTLRPEMTMLGRSYSQGYERDLEHWILKRPAATATNPEWPWAVWYPLRRSGAFAKLEPREQGKILKEHAIIGRAYGGQDLAHDIRLACHGMDANDNEYVIGLIGATLHPLSHVVQSMRRTRQTSEFIVKMGPFFVGRALQQQG